MGYSNSGYYVKKARTGLRKRAREKLSVPQVVSVQSNLV